MPAADDEAFWSSLRCVDGRPYDPRPALEQLRSGDRTAWREFWGILHRQGRVCGASYAVIPDLVRIHKAEGDADFNTYAFAVMVEDARHRDGNPPPPPAILPDYEEAWRELEALALEEFPRARGKVLVQSMIALLAMARGRPILARICLFAEEELEALLLEAGVQ